MQATSYIHATAASSLASETRNISISSAVINALNSFIDELLFNVLAHLCNAPTSSSIRLPVKTASLKDAFLAATTKSPAIAREAVLEAEIQQSEWIKLKGKSSDPALPAVAPGNLSRKTSASLLETIPAARELQTESHTCTLDDLYSELKVASEQLSQLGRRAGLSSTSGARITAALNCQARGISKHVSPLLRLYISAIVTYLATYIVRGCGRIVEQDSGSSVATLGTLLEYIGEDHQLSELWNSMHVKTVVDRELALSTYSSPFLASSTSMVQQRSSESSSSNSLPGERAMPPSTTTTTTSRKLSFRRKGNTPYIVSNSTNARGVSSMDAHRQRSGSALTQDVNLPVSSIPFRTSPPSTANASTSMQRKRDHSASSLDAEGTAKLPAGTLAFLEYGEENDLPLRKNSLQSRQHLGTSSGSQQSTAATQLDGIDFESLISGGQTRKLSLTPTRFALTGSSSTRQASASPAQDENMFAKSSRGAKMQARTARPIASGLGAADSSSEEDKEMLDDWDEEDEAIFGPRKPKNTAKKQTLLDMLNSDPPWAGPSSSSSDAVGQNSKASKMLGGDAARIPPFGHPSSSPSSLPAGQQTRKFSPIANLNVVSSASLRPTTANSLAASVRPSTAGSALDPQALNDFPIPPERKSPPTLTSHKSSPNLSYGASSSSFTSGASPEDVLSRPLQPMRRKLVAKDERAARAERHDDLIAFLQDAPPPTTSSFANNAADIDPITPTSLSSSSSKSRLGSGKLRHLLSTGGRRPSLPAIPSSSHEESAIDEFGRLPRSSPAIGSSSRKLSKMTGIMSPSTSGGRHFSSRSHSNSVSSAEAFKAEMEISAMDKEIARKQQYREDTVAQREYQNIYPKLHTRQMSNPSSSAMPLQQRQDAGIASAVLPLSPTRPFATTVPVPASISQRTYSKQLPALQSQPSYSSSMENRVAAPLLTPEHSKDDLYSMTRPVSSSVMAQTTSTPLDTPPATPYDKKPSPSLYTQNSSERVPRTHTGRSASPVTSMSPDPSKTSRRTSLIKRKAPPKADEEDLLEVRTSPIEEVDSPSATRQREVHAASTLSISAATIRTESEKRTREASTSSSFVSMSSSSSASSNITSRIFTLPTSTQAPIQTVLEAAEQQSRPASTVILPLPPRPSSSLARPGTGNNTPEVHRLLLSLRNSMVSAADVNECLTLVDAAMFEVAYDIQSPPYATSTIAEEEEDACQEEGTFAYNDARPVFYASQVANRAYMALLEWFMLREEERTLVYPRGFHRLDATKTFNDLAPFMERGKSTSGGISSHAMAKEPSFGYSIYESAESESDEVGTPRLGIGRDSQDIEEILQAAVVKA